MLLGQLPTALPKAVILLERNGSADNLLKGVEDFSM
jgi:hypothetical protein